MDARKVSMRSDVSKNLKDDEVFTVRLRVPGSGSNNNRSTNNI